MLLLCLAPGCRDKNNTPAAQSAPPLTETISSGPIELTILADPALVHLDRDILLTMRICAPANIEVTLPPIENRLKGFILNGAFTREAAAQDGKLSKDYCFRLTPTLAEEYRIAPLAITWRETRQPGDGGSPSDLSAIAQRATAEAAAAKEGLPPIAASASGGWFATRPVLFQAAGISKDAPGVNIHDIIPPIWIYPPFKTVALWIAAILGAAGAFYLLRWLSRRVRRAIQLRRMSPRERALYELNELLERDLVGKEKIKEFYLELTMIVRRYIERAHGIRAPEQTTEEFLSAAAENQEFGRAVVAKLRKFLQTADLVKFAAYRPEQNVIDQAILTARDYIVTDESAQSAVGQNRKSKIENRKQEHVPV